MGFIIPAIIITLSFAGLADSLSKAPTETRQPASYLEDQTNLAIEENNRYQDDQMRQIDQFNADFDRMHADKAQSERIEEIEQRLNTLDLE